MALAATTTVPPVLPLTPTLPTTRLPFNTSPFWFPVRLTPPEVWLNTQPLAGSPISTGPVELDTTTAWEGLPASGVTCEPHRLRKDAPLAAMPPDTLEPFTTNAPPGLTPIPPVTRALFTHRVEPAPATSGPVT